MIVCFTFSCFSPVRKVVCRLQFPNYGKNLKYMACKSRVHDVGLKGKHTKNTYLLVLIFLTRTNANQNNIFNLINEEIQAFESHFDVADNNGREIISRILQSKKAVG